MSATPECAICEWSGYVQHIKANQNLNEEKAEYTPEVESTIFTLHDNPPTPPPRTRSPIPSHPLITILVPTHYSQDVR